MAYDHTTTIKAKASKLSALTASAGNFISAEIMNVASRHFANDIGDTLYEEYMTYLETEAYVSGKLFYKMTADEKKYDGLVTAETYLCLHYLVVALKKTDKNSVLYDKEMFGGDSIDPAELDKIFEMADAWYETYKTTVSKTVTDGTTNLKTGKIYAI